jgi:DNA polymerase III alpha subunit
VTFVPLRVRTEYSFRQAYGRIPAVLDALQRTAPDCTVAAITDEGTWGHSAWAKACAERKLTPCFGAEIVVVPNAEDRAKQASCRMTFLARNQAGLDLLYRLVAKAGEQFYFTPRLGYRDVSNSVRASSDLVVLAGAGARLDLLPASGGVYLALSPTTPEWNQRVTSGAGRMYEKVLVPDTRYPRVGDKPYYQVHAGQQFRVNATVPLHMLPVDQLRRLVPQADDESVLNTLRIVASLEPVVLPTVGTVKFEHAMDMVRGMCESGRQARFPSGWTMEYHDRLQRELDVIEKKGFADYFVLVADIVQWAKRRMLVGPGRGSSAGSLVCYLLGITDVDPIPHGLLFERFIDETRNDWPDIDVDFADAKRGDVFAYLATTYGADKVGRLGTVMRYKPDSALNDVAKELHIPPWEIAAFKDRVEARAEGDTDHDRCIRDALTNDPEGPALLKKYPGLAAAAVLEGHAKQTGKHAAGVVVADRPLAGVCGIGRDTVLQVDKVDAEARGMLKVDVLGLSTCTVLDEVLTLIRKTRDWLLSLPLDDDRAYEVFRRGRFAGIFQFEGYTQGNLARRMSVDRFEDITALGALSRPGPNDAGATDTYIARRMGREHTIARHPIYDRITRETYGVIAYQEQMMFVLREVGDMDWPTVNKLRKAINKKLGAEWFNQYREQFVAGAGRVQMDAAMANSVWDAIVTFGAYAFNKSHAVAYGLLSYWCAYLKAHHPLEFACALLRHPKDDESAGKALRDLVAEGHAFVPVDLAQSGATWEIVDGKLLGGLTTVVGCGEAMAKEILTSRRLGAPLRQAVLKLFTPARTPFDRLFEGDTRFADIYANPRAHHIKSTPHVHHVEEIQGQGDYVFLAKIDDRTEKQKEGRPFCTLRVHDDSGSIQVRVNRREYHALGRQFIEPPAAQVLHKWAIFKGRVFDDKWNTINLEAVRWLDPKPEGF